MEYVGVPVTWGQSSRKPAAQIIEQLSSVSYAHLNKTLSMEIL